MSKYDLNFRKLIVQLLPIRLRGNLVDFIEMLIKPLKRHFYQFSVFKDKEKQALTYNAQMPMLQKLLNDTLVTSDIYIEDAPYNAVDGVWENAEYKPKEIGFWGLLGKDEIGYNGFVVYVPSGVAGKTNIIKALVDRYKLAGTTYRIVIYN